MSEETIQAQLDRRIATVLREQELLEKRFDDQIEFVSKTADEREKANKDVLTLMDKVSEQRWMCSEEAVSKAEIATEKRFDAMNEFRAQLTDQATTFAKGEVVDAKIESHEKRINRNESLLANIQGRQAAVMGGIGLAAGTIGALITHVFR